MNSRGLRIDFAVLCREFGLKVAKPGDRHYHNGWISMPCPFCSGDSGNHLGFNPTSNIFTCWRCGKHPKFQTLGALLGVSAKEAYKICEERFGHGQRIEASHVRVKQSKPFKLPGEYTMPDLHREYLKERGFNPDYVANIYGLKFVGMFGPYKYRVILPAKIDGKTISFTSRDVTGRHKARYLSCPKNEEVKPIKDSLFGEELCQGETVIVVEGPFDAMKLGPGAVAVFGIDFSLAQVKRISKYRKSFVLFDPERQATKAANKLRVCLSAYPKHECRVIEIDGNRDAGDLDEQEVRELWRKIKSA